MWIDRRGGTGEEEIVTRKVCSEPAHWSERSPTFTAPATNCSDGGGGTVDVSWAAPDIYWGDGGESTSSRKYQLWVDGSLAQDNISWTATSYQLRSGRLRPRHTYFDARHQPVRHLQGLCVRHLRRHRRLRQQPDERQRHAERPARPCAPAPSSSSPPPSPAAAACSYQWTRNGSNISGATSSTYWANDTGTNSYNCVVRRGSCLAGVMDAVRQQITWQDEPNFSGITRPPTAR